ncbi:HAD family phosphatase [Streptosporangium sp. 'caverna']|uniref:HAD family hydrolase n=1 Tax=Streptosporangium sp. 'caverna' TaxID=2202249 RepID=UPI000D7E86E6|nr:HAD family phosphatase [Streptosporangium sp. 'caverna']AWS42756.1 HAD family hydrolase [Streptosporangium sp. 'caverna']
MADTVLFDLFGVIARQQSPSGQELLVATASVSASAFWQPYWALRMPYDRGEVTGSGYWRQVAAALGTTFDDHQIAHLIAADIASWSAIDDDMVALVEQTAASGRRIALLSNIPEELAAHYEQHHRWLKHFDVVAFSCRTGHTKPDLDAYRWCCQTLDLAPERILFVDDRAENIQAAEAIGMRTHLFTGPTQARQAITEPDPVPRRR